MTRGNMPSREDFEALFSAVGELRADHASLRATVGSLAETVKSSLQADSRRHSDLPVWAGVIISAISVVGVLGVGIPQRDMKSEQISTRAIVTDLRGMAVRDHARLEFIDREVLNLEERVRYIETNRFTSADAERMENRLLKLEDRK